jgi:hypothetical protein
MSGAAQQEDVVEQLDFVASGTVSAPGLKQVASERLEAHRRRRAESKGPGLAVDAAAAELAERKPRAHAGASSRIRDAVAARYQNSVTYREFLAQEAERALQQAHAEAEVAARNVQALAEAQMQLLEEIQQWEQPGPQEIAFVPATEWMETQQPVEITSSEAPAISHSQTYDYADTTPATDFYSTGLKVRLYEDLSAGRTSVQGERSGEATFEADVNEATALDAEIAFRRAPEFEQHVPEPTGIAGNLIEFPRQLVAARKVRPRLAEGPLREETAPEPQLRIFEVEPEQVSAAPVELASAPEWQSILLEGARLIEPVTRIEVHSHFTIQPQTARHELRMMATMVDACCVGAALIGFMAVAARVAGPALHDLPLPLLAATTAGVACVLFVMYQILFFTLGEATPGMRYARIGLCTFADSNPTRSAMRRRVLAMLLAACPLGLGFAWAWMDEDGLGWHDRISRMYLRAY